MYFRLKFVNQQFYSIRGRLASSTILVKNLGAMTSYILGSTVDYTTIPLICIVFPIVFYITFIMLPNTPQFHLQNGQPHVSETISWNDNDAWISFWEYLNFRKLKRQWSFTKATEESVKRRTKHSSRNSKDWNPMHMDRKHERKFRLRTFVSCWFNIIRCRSSDDVVSTKFR